MNCLLVRLILNDYCGAISIILVTDAVAAGFGRFALRCFALCFTHYALHITHYALRIYYRHRLCLRTKRTNKMKIVITKHTMHFMGLAFF
mmetsp:Transcript_18805/g.40929  ORF Transcript_18805/g.40929 Transcript_18805/m.40929 type:complete len:90 (-) Transcript_18805:939-1208(-)